MAKDKCIMCNAETLYDETTHIDLRQGYVEGCGQVCRECWDSTYPTVKDKPGGFLTIPRRLVFDLPNDQMLGEEIRKLFYQTQ